MTRKKLKLLGLLTVSLLHSSPAAAHRVDAAYSQVQISAAKDSDSISGVTASGMGGEYTLFTSSNLAIKAQGLTHSFEGVTVLMGGGGGIAYSVFGGQPLTFSKEDFSLVGVPRFHSYLYLGAASYTYNILPYLPIPEASTTGARNITPRVGQFFGLTYGFGMEYYLTYEEKLTHLLARAYYSTGAQDMDNFIMEVIIFQFGVGMEI